MHPKFIRIKDYIYNVSEIKRALHKNGETSFDIEGKHFVYIDPTGYMWSAFNCFVENLNADDMMWHTCFDVEKMIEEGKEITNQCEKAIEDYEKKD